MKLWALLLVTAVGRPVAAQPAARLFPQISWEATTTGCERPADLMVRIARLIGTRPEGLAGKLLRLEANVVHAAPQSWQMRLAVKTSGGSGERRFGATSCQQLVSAAVLIVALAIDPAAVKRQKVAARQTAPVSSKTSAPFQLALRPQVGLSVGILPSAGVSVGLAAALLWRSLRLELDAAHELAQQQGVAGHPAAAGELQLPLRGGLRGCFRQEITLRRNHAPRFEIDLCGGSEAGWLRGAGLNIAAPSSGDTLWFGLVASTALSCRIWRRFWARLDGHLGFSPTRPRFEIEGVGEVHRPSALVGRLGLGLETRFW